MAEGAPSHKTPYRVISPLPLSLRVDAVFRRRKEHHAVPFLFSRIWKGVQLMALKNVLDALSVGFSVLLALSIGFSVSVGCIVYRIWKGVQLIALKNVLCCIDVLLLLFASK